MNSNVITIDWLHFLQIFQFQYRKLIIIYFNIYDK